MQIYLLSVLGLLLTGNIGAFLLQFKILPVAGVVVVVIGLLLMFALGFYVGSGRRHLLRRRNRLVVIAFPARRDQPMRGTPFRL